MTKFFEAHRSLLERAVEAARERGYWSAYPEIPSTKVYGESAKADAEAAFEALLGRPFQMDAGQMEGGGLPAGVALVGSETSPYGRDLGITYPAIPVAQAVDRAEAAGIAWGRAPVDDRVGICLEILARLNRQSFLVANAVMHTSGQAFMMAFQAGGPHAQDRGLEAVAYAYEEMSRIPEQVRWEKPQGKASPIVLEKRFRVVPRGVAVAIGCATFPTWNTYPGLFASLATGNPVIVKPHPGAILPLALTVRIGREVLAEAGFDPDVLQLAPDTAAAPIAKELATHPRVAIVDFTGSPAFGRWIRENVRQAVVFTEEAGVNAIVIDSTRNFRGMCENIAFSLSLYSGQMCTAPQNVFVPRDGIETDEGRKSFAEVAEGIARSIDRLLSDPDRAASVLGCVQSDDTLRRLQAARSLGRVVRDTAPIRIPGADAARTASPLVVAVDVRDEDAYLTERFGPISFVVATDDTCQSIAVAAASAKSKGAITAALYSTDEDVIDSAGEAFAGAGAPLSVNLTGGIFVNQSAAFSDYHVSGANPAGNACLTDAAFVAGRFHVLALRRPDAA